MSEERLVRQLIERGRLPPEQAMRVLAERERTGLGFGELLVEAKLVTEEHLLEALVAATGLERQSAAELELSAAPPIQLEAFPRAAAERLGVLPIEITSSAATLLVADPFERVSIELAQRALGVSTLTLKLATKSEIVAAVPGWYERPFEEESPPISLPVEPVALPPLVLIADRDAALVSQLAAGLDGFDCEVAIAHEGDLALAIARQRAPAVLLADAALPKVDGFTLLLEVRQAAPEAAVFITSNRADEFRQTKALDLGADDFIVKPFAAAVVVAKIKREVQKRWDQRPATVDGVSGSLERMDVLELVQTLGFGQKTVHVSIQYASGKRAELALSGGALTGCRFEGQEGEEAFFMLAREMGNKGQFRIEYRPSPLARTLTKDNSYYLMEAVRRIDEERR